MTTDLAAFAEENGVKYFMVSYTDLFGGQRAKLVPAQAIAGMQADGAGFAGFATWLDLTPAHPDLLAMPDPSSVIQLPWKPEVAWVAATGIMEGKPVDQVPRNVLGNLVKDAAEAGLHVKTGVEAEFFILTADGGSISDEYDTAEKPCYDQQAVMRRYDVIAEICDHMLELGWGPYQNDHEDANGQFEINYTYSDALTSADRHVFVRMAGSEIANELGLICSFMAKVDSHRTGNGMHLHISMSDEDTPNIFHDDSDARGMGLSETGYHFLGGILHHAKALCALAAPTVNSYKRLVIGEALSGATWAPAFISYGDNNRSALVRVPYGRLEFRLADGGCNPYLVTAALIAAGLDGVDNKRDPGEPLNVNHYTADLASLNVDVLPQSLDRALDALEKDKLFAETLGQGIIDEFVRIKRMEWTEYMRHVSDWEVDRYLEFF